MNKAQERTIEKIKIMINNQIINISPNKKEIKKFEIEETEYGHISLVFEVGLIGDEGTMAEVFGRDGAHLFIRRGGAIEYYNKRGTCKRFTSGLIYEPISQTF